LLFKEDKKRTMEKLEYAVKNNFVDKEIMPLVNKINEKENYYTTSSCIGRCGIMEFPKNKTPKIYSKWLGKWHHYGTEEELITAINNKSNDFSSIVFIMNSPILHIACENIDYAKKLLECGYHNGLKASSIKSVNNNRIIVEILTTYKVDAPIGLNNKLIVNLDYLKILLKTGNEKLKLARQNLNRFYNKLDNL